MFQALRMVDCSEELRTDKTKPVPGPKIVGKTDRKHSCPFFCPNSCLIHVRLFFSFCPISCPIFCRISCPILMYDAISSLLRYSISDFMCSLMSDVMSDFLCVFLSYFLSDLMIYFTSDFDVRCNLKSYLIFDV